MRDTRFILASNDRAREKAKLLKSLLSRAGKEASLTSCQATVARALGYGTWAELVRPEHGIPSRLDEDAGLDAWRARIERQCTAIGDGYGLDPRIAAGVALALRLTSRARSEDMAADIERFLPMPRTSVPMDAGPGTGEVVLHVLRWEEIEVGWGERPDGYSVHECPAAGMAYVDAYWASMPERRPSEYSAPAGNLVAMAFPEDGEVAVAVRSGKVRFEQHESVPIRQAAAAG